MYRTRTQIRLQPKDVETFVKMINSDGSADKYILENFDGSVRADARSYLGALYISTDYNDETYLVNETNDGVYPSEVNKYRF